MLFAVYHYFQHSFLRLGRGTRLDRLENIELTYIAPGVKSYDVSLENQTATVVAEPSLAYETVLATIKKTGKKVNTGEADGEVKPVELVSEA